MSALCARARRPRNPPIGLLVVQNCRRRPPPPSKKVAGVRCRRDDDFCGAKVVRDAKEDEEEVVFAGTTTTSSFTRRNALIIMSFLATPPCVGTTSFIVGLGRRVSSAFASDDTNNINSFDDYGTMRMIQKSPDPEAFEKDVSYLSSCAEVSESCVSTTNDDEGHFINPWAFSTSKTEAMRELVAVALGNKEERAVSRAIPAVRGASVGIEAMRKKARESALRDLALEERDGEGDNDSSSSSSSSNIIMPEMKGPLGDCVEFDINNGKIVLRLFDVAGGVNSNDADVVINESDVFDAEFYFLDNDAIVDIRIAARDAPKGGSFALSYDKGIKFEKNRARKLADTIRQKLGWEIVPVIASFDPKWDSKRRMWFEDILDPQESVSGEWNSFSGTSWIPNPAAIIDKLSSR